jgi:hypothetical protein
MRNITDIFEAVASQTALGAKIKEICSSMGTYDDERKAWIYEPDKPIWRKQSHRDARAVRTRPIVKGLIMNDKGACGFIFGNALEEEDECLKTVAGLEKDPVLYFMESDTPLTKDDVKEIIDSVLNYKKRR